MTSVLALIVIFLFSCNCDTLNTESTLFKDFDFRVTTQFHQHHTADFYGGNTGISHIILRRGAAFEFSVILNKEVDGETIKVQLSFEAHNDRLVVDLPKEENNDWKMEQVVNGSQIDATIHIPCDAPVGEWSMKVFLKKSDGRVFEVIESGNKIIILFNPWSKEDDAYFPEEEKLSEYLMSESGAWYSFKNNRLESNAWIFGQFQKGVIDAILMVLKYSKLNATERGNIVLVSRDLTHLMNYVEYLDELKNVVKDYGVLIGRWQEPYTYKDGSPATNPMEWTGSAPIFKQYLESRGKPVSFGQCHVFGGILTTAYRALGIASRPVSNFLSAHSIHRDLRVDIYLNETRPAKDRDLIWNYHVWVQGWMSRKDLGEDFSGWQELDATPQERNNDLYQVGPASAAAINSSQLMKSYETSFVYEEVNADVVYWYANHAKVNPVKVGLAVVTKKYLEDEPENITIMYKPPENTKEERDSYRKAAESLNITPASLNYPIVSRSQKKKIVIDVRTQSQVFVGSSVIFDVNIRTSTPRTKQITVDLRATSMYYNGQEADVLKSESYDISVKGGRKIKFVIKPEEYFDKLHDQNTIRIEAIVRSGEEVSFDMKHISLENPVLKISGPKSVNVKQKFAITLEFQNPYKFLLSNCYAAIEGIRIRRKVMKIKDIKPSSIAKTTFQLESSYAQQENIVVKFFASNGINMRAVMKLNVRGEKVYQFNQCTLNPVKTITKNILPNSIASQAFGVDHQGQMVRMITKGPFRQRLVKI